MNWPQSPEGKRKRQSIASVNMIAYTVTITDPHYRGRIVACHAGFSVHEARELVTVYLALGYPARCIRMSSDADRERAA